MTSVTEGYPLNVEWCRRKLGNLGIDIHEMSDCSTITFADSCFDLVKDCHSSYDTTEIYQILKPDGLLITQQIGEDNNHELVKMLLLDSLKAFAGYNLKSQT